MKRSVVDDIVQPITTALGSDKTRISMALAVALAFATPQPTGPVSGTPEMYYIQHHMNRVNRFIAEFNERFLVEVSDIADAVKKIWSTRYDMLYSRNPEKLIAIARGECPIRDFLASYSFDPETTALVISAGIASLDRIERVLADDGSNTSDI